MSDADMVGLEDTPDFGAEVIEASVPWQGKLWSMRDDLVQLQPGTVVRRQYLDHPGAVAVLAMDEEDRVLLINQYRHPVRARLWEIPAGLLDHGDEEPLAAAQRELAEEVDLEAQEWAVLTDTFFSPGCSTESCRIFLARDLSTTKVSFPREAEEAEIEKRWVTLEDATSLVLNGAFHNPSLVIGVLAATAARRDNFKDLRPTNAQWLR